MSRAVRPIWDRARDAKPLPATPKRHVWIVRITLGALLFLPRQCMRHAENAAAGLVAGTVEAVIETGSVVVRK